MSVEGDLPGISDPRVRAVWGAFKARGWVIGSLQMAQVAVATLEEASAPAVVTNGRPSGGCPACGSNDPHGTFCSAHRWHER